MSEVQNETIRPIRDFVLLQPMEDPEKTRSGLLYVPKTAKAKELRGKVLAVGPGRYLENGQRVAPEVNVGEVVICLEYNLATSTGLQELGHGERPPVLIPEGDIIAVIEP